MNLFGLINQKKNRELLEKSLRNSRISNAYLFYGPEGCGHEGFAMEYAAMLNCTAESNQPCGNCPSCKKIKNLQHANLQLVFPIPGAKNNTKETNPFHSFSESEIEELQNKIQNKAQNPYEKLTLTGARSIPINFIREIKKKMYLKSQESGWKITIIFDAHLLTIPAANAFLKILEEPPEKSSFILTTSSFGSLLPTIISRCHPLYFPPISNEELTTELKKKLIPENKIKLMINLSAGDLNYALQLSEEALETLRKDTLEILRGVAVWNKGQIFNSINKLVTLKKQDPDYFRQIMLSITFWFRDAAALRSGLPASKLIHSDMITEISKFANAFPEFDIFSINSSVEKCIGFINHNVYINLALTDMLFEIHKAIINK